MTYGSRYFVWVWGHTQKGRRTWRRARKAAQLALKRAERYLDAMYGGVPGMVRPCPKHKPTGIGVPSMRQRNRR